MTVEGQPAAVVTATTYMPKAMITAEIKNDNSVSMIASRRANNRWLEWWWKHTRRRFRKNKPLPV
jgi:uncharacterized protein YccT (UPF0319 family)